MNDTPLDPADYTLRITVPDPFVATASGTLVETLERENGKTFVWRVDLPVTEVTFAVGEYRTDRLTGPSGLPIDIAFPTDATVADIPSLKQLPNMLAFLRARLGPFPFPSLGLTLVRLFGGGGDSTPGRINLSDVQEIVVVHELAHQWMGGSVGNASTQDAWLREGLPTYVEVLWTARREGAQAGESLIEDFRRQLGPSTRPPLDVDDLADRSDDATFLRGALVMHALKWGSARSSEPSKGSSRATEERVRQRRTSSKPSSVLLVATSKVSSPHGYPVSRCPNHVTHYQGSAISDPAPCRTPFYSCPRQEPNERGRVFHRWLRIGRSLRYVFASRARSSGSGCHRTRRRETPRQARRYLGTVRPPKGAIQAP